MKTISTALVLAAGLAFAQTAGDVKKETGEAYDATKKYANETKEEFEARMDARLKALKDDLVKLKDKTRGTADATGKELDAQAKKAETKFNEAKKASGNAWTKLKGGVVSAVDELEKGVNNAKK